MQLENNSLKYQNYLFVFLLLSSLLKAFLYIYGFTFDLVKLAFILAGLDIIFQLVIRKVTFPRISLQIFIIILLFYSWMIFTIFYSPSLTYKYEKAGKFAGNIIFFLYPIFIKKIDYNSIIKLYSIILIPLSILYIYILSIMWKVSPGTLGIFQDARLDYAGFDYLTLAENIGILFILLNYFKKSIWLQVITLGLLFASAARGPIIFLLFIVFIMNFNKIYLFRIKKIRKIGLALAITLIMFVTYYEQIYPYIETSFMRFTDLISGESSSVEARTEMFRFAFNQPFKSFGTLVFGNGIGSFGVLRSNIDGKAYPHNILLETFFEMGLIGFFLLIILLWMTFNKFSFKKNVFFPLFVLVFLNSMKSSNLNDLWVFFAFIGGISIYSSITSKEDIIKNQYRLCGDKNY